MTMLDYLTFNLDFLAGWITAAFFGFCLWKMERDKRVAAEKNRDHWFDLTRTHYKKLYAAEKKLDCVKNAMKDKD